ncbi:MAG: flagellar biosynthesis regulator FlaF [Pseudomonadota bacterium]
MPSIQQTSSAYFDLARTTKSDKSLEYDVIASVTAQLKAASESNVTYQKSVEALDRNRRMWGVIATSVADSENSYPEELRANLFYLFEFTSYMTQKILVHDAKIDALVDINMAVLRGLKGNIT